MTKKIAILLSGRGSNFLAIYENIRKGELDAEICAVISDKKSAKGLLKAKELGLPSYFVSFKNKLEGEKKVIEIVECKKADLICLAGFMRVLSRDFVKRFKWRILNIHPSLLPSFPGLEAQEQALEYGVKYSGCTVHFVDEGVDSGPIVKQAVVKVFDDDTPEKLADRILREEHKIYSEAINIVLNNQYVINGRRVLLKKS